MKTLIACLLSLTATFAYAAHCPQEMKAIDAKLATGVKLTDADMAKVKQMRADGETAHKAGKHDESIKHLDAAKKLLGI